MADQEAFDQDTELDVAELGTSGGGEDLAKAQTELETLKSKLASMEQEAASLKEFQEKAQQNAGLAPQPESTQEAEEKAQIDGRSVYVGNVDYAVTPEELQMHFQGCGTVNRVTILTDRMGNPKGFAYIEFLEPDAVANALLLTDSTLQGRQIKVNPKRTNVPGMKQIPPHMRGRGRGFGRGRGPPRGGYGYGGYGYAPRGRRGRFYSPY
ncbi:hypothetical protein WJX73_005340 [Symbiochloris irregularis]|uniref:RRM domain-containing protein n=1 Tax=Symbiochloris irregularis TaxID=706552 RepID=A0AAW1NSG2_9CHLO